MDARLGRWRRRIVAAVLWGALLVGAPRPASAAENQASTGRAAPASPSRGDAGQQPAATPSSDRGAGRELLRDRDFQRGFRLCEPAPGRRVPYGELRGFEPGPPVWDLDQWSSRFRLLPSEFEVDTAGVHAWTNVAKVVRLSRGGEGAERGLTLGVKASAEYGSRARQAQEPWVHLLVEQEIVDPPALSGLRSARFRIEARLLEFRRYRSDDYSPDRHAAQFQVFLTVQNRNRASAGYGRLLWFGIPLYDDRHSEPPAHKTRDTGGTDMFIFTPPGSVYASRSAHDGDWITVDRDLVPLFREALESAWSRGFLTESRRLEDYGVTTVNLGWEVPGTFDVSMAVRGLSVWVVTGADAKE